MNVIHENTLDDEIILKVNNLSKKYCKSLKKSIKYGLLELFHPFKSDNDLNILRDEEFWVFKNLNLSIKKGEVLGIIGQNGAGKSTLLKIISNIIPPDDGSIIYRGLIGSMIEIGGGFIASASGRENIYIQSNLMGVDRDEIDSKMDDIIKFADIGDFIDSPVKYYSSGMYVRLGFSIAVHCEPSILLLDEVLAVGDVGFQEKCFNKISALRSNGISILLVSHNMHAISNFSDRVLFIHQGKCSIFEDVEKGIIEYNKLFHQESLHEVQIIKNKGDFVSFFEINSNKQIFEPNETITITIKYKAVCDIQNVIVDTALINFGDSKIIFQATNQAFSQKITLYSGIHALNITIPRINLQSIKLILGVGIWEENMSNLILWIRYPLQFSKSSKINGNNVFTVNYEQDTIYPH